MAGSRETPYDGPCPSTPVMIRLNDDLHALQVKEPRKTARKGSYIVISGGTAANDFVQAFGKDCAFVLPGEYAALCMPPELISRAVSDDGGSSSEILRCLGGPSIGDIRSRLIRLIPVPENGVTDVIEGARLEGIQAVHDLFAQRFPATGTEREVKEMWGDSIEGTSGLWTGIPEDRREAIRGAFRLDECPFSNLPCPCRSILRALQYPHPAPCAQALFVQELFPRQRLFGSGSGHARWFAGRDLHVQGVDGFTGDGAGDAGHRDESLVPVFEASRRTYTSAERITIAAQLVRNYLLA